MAKYKIWDREETLITPRGDVFTPEQVFAKHPASALPEMKYIICDAPVNMAVFMEFNATIEHYRRLGVQFEEGMTDQEMLDAISDYEANPPEHPPTAEERIAAAMEWQNLMSLPDTEPGVE